MKRTVPFHIFCVRLKYLKVMWHVVIILFSSKAEGKNFASSFDTCLPFYALIRFTCWMISQTNALHAIQVMMW